MDLDKARQAMALGDKIDRCNAVLGQIEKGTSSKAILRHALISSADGGNAQTLVFLDELEITPDETSAIGKALANILTSRLQEYTAALEAL